MFGIITMFSLLPVCCIKKVPEIYIFIEINEQTNLQEKNKAKTKSYLPTQIMFRFLKA